MIAHLQSLVRSSSKCSAHTQRTHTTHTSTIQWRPVAIIVNDDDANYYGDIIVIDKNNNIAGPASSQLQHAGHPSHMPQKKLTKVWK